MAASPINLVLPKASRLVYGCMGLGGNWDNSPVNQDHVNQANAAIDAALEIGINYFDHADIYTMGKAEQVFGQVLAQRPELREQIILQTKCAIRFGDDKWCGRYDWSADYIRQSVEDSLRRLQSDSIDVMMLHRPDPLAEMDEVAEVLQALKDSGKVQHFGVSNMSGAQIAHLQSVLSFPLVANQLEMSLSKLDWLNHNIAVNDEQVKGHSFAAGTLEYCAMNKVQIQAWGSLARGLFSGADLSNATQQQRDTAQLVRQYADQYSTSPEAIVLAWLIRHPAGIQPVIGSVNVDRIRACADATKVELSREQWYQLYVTSRGQALP
ncbi:MULTISPECIES: aldo/keto reductase [unclassified Agarivorans]|uniref:aldo/keto reductase n=1 Tax=unclassified Agarivorans TaxID=2636026 RepID=UPI0026E25BDD|nr:MULTISPECIES: aldo/keto reductase [unclassified Agarivorans]MDO6685381.1 aldo/keto reductase [Agarivorans sp. 3_MG-2023]MDO6715767.1 aldo/keto reductase [Agarivorans sp. 2_MG-2023]